MKELLLKLENGMRVCLLPNPGVVSVAVYLKGLAGSNYETLSNVGTAHLLEHLVLKGSQNFINEYDLLNLVTGDGGKYIGVTSRDDVLFGTHVLSDCLEKSLMFLSEIFYRPLLCEYDFEEVKMLVKTEIDRCFDSPEKLISRLAYATLFPNTRLAKFNIGDVKGLNNLNISTIRNFHKKYYTNNRFVLVISGNFNVTDTKKLLKKYFDTRTIESKDIFTAEITNKRVSKIHTEYNFLQDYVRVDYSGFKIDRSTRFSTQVLAKYLSSAIKREVQKNGYAYRTDVNSHFMGNCSFFSLFGSCGPDNLNRLLDTFRLTIYELQNHVDTQLIESSKKSLITNLLFALEKPSMRAEYYSDILLHGTVKQNYTYEINQIKKVDKAVVLKTAKNIFTQNPKITLISQTGNNRFS